MSDKSHIGVDCGGTQCRIAWSDGENRVDFIGKGANFTTSPQACAKAITDALHALSDKSRQPLDRLTEAPAYVGVAGILSATAAQELRRALPFREAKVEDDRRAQVIGALGARDGFVASLGTGSFFARRAGSSIQGIGGWGFSLGDEASGAWLGRGLLRLSLHAHDGLVRHTALTEAILDEFGGPEALVDFARDALPSEFAQLATGLAAAAEAGDPQGRMLMKTGADWIGKSLQVLGWRKGGRICLPGRLGAAYAPYLPDAMREAISTPEGSALDGALMMAARRVRETA